MAKSEGCLYIQGLYENFNSVSTFIENPFKKIPFSYVPKGASEEEIRKDILFSYLTFYLNPDKLKQIFTRPDLGAGWFNAGEKLMVFIRKIPALILLVSIMCIKYGELFFDVLRKKNTSLSIGELLGVFTDLFRRKRQER